ncbi:MAG: EamA family transporter [Marinosulfonomonas sp.]|nr:EamA family transporter [Marinosulfonomonas sp.]
MEAWIYITIAAAFSQNLRFMLQKHLKSTHLSTAGATFARFLYSAPLIAVMVVVYMQWRGVDVPVIAFAFWAYVVFGGLGQIIGTMCVVALFAERNFAVGLMFKNTEVILAAVVGFIVLGEGLSAWGIVAILTGFIGLILLSDAPGRAGPLLRRIINRAAGLGLLAGLSFAISAVAYRGAVLAVASEDVFLQANLTLAVVTAFQTCVLALWLSVRQAGEIGRVVAAWRVAGVMGIMSMIGSLCWFTAFALQTAAYVKGLGQVELLFGAVASYFYYHERSTRREVAGIVILLLSILMLVLVI